MSKHTPGPWEIKISDKKHTAIVTGDTHGWGWDVIHKTEISHSGELEANARLIAAAPDLLDAVKLLLGSMALGLAKPYNHELSDNEVAELALKAIAKVEGCVK